MSSIKKHAFVSTKSLLGWLGFTVLPLCAFYATYLQQKTNSLLASATMAQTNAISTLQRFGTATTYLLAGKNKQFLPDAFADASHSDFATQFCYVLYIVKGTFN